MNIPEIFLHELWETWRMICSLAVGFSIGMLVHFVSKGCHTFFTRAQSFPEFAAFTKDDQQSLLGEASREAFSALSIVPILVLFAFCSGGDVLIRTLQKVTSLPEWVVLVLFVQFVGFGHWLARRLEAQRVRPFLKKLIDGQNGKTEA